MSSLYGARQDLSQCVFLVISQSGRSPDLLSAAAAAKASGALVVALVNAEDAPLVAVADHVIALRAGPELSVAATKSYICALAPSCIWWRIGAPTKRCCAPCRICRGTWKPPGSSTGNRWSRR